MNVKKATQTVDFFLCTNAANGFFSLCKPFDEPIEGERRFLIKGSAGGGKSTAMKRAADHFTGADHLIERIHCSSDPDSLDGVILHDAHCSIVDATPPHAVEPDFPASFQSVCDFWSALDEETLTPRLGTIASLSRSISACHAKCRRLLACADLLLLENRRTVEDCTDLKKAEEFAVRFAEKHFPQTGKTGCFRDRLLSAFTMHGVHTYTETPQTLCGKTILLDDPFGLVADTVLRILADAAKTAGYTVYRCPHPLMPDRFLSAVLVPECDLAFLNRSPYTPWKTGSAQRIIHFTRFADIEKLRKKRQSIRFIRKAADAILSSAADQLKEAKRLHDLLEVQYRDAVDFSLVDLRTKELIEKIEARYKEAE